MAFGSAIIGRGKYLRPTGVIPEATRGQNISLRISGLRESSRIPEELELAYDRMIFQLTREIEVACKALVPGGAEGKLGRQVHANLTSRGRILVGTFNSEFAAALNHGFISRARSGKSLRGFDGEGGRRFRTRNGKEAGSTIFTTYVIVHGRHFLEKWLAATTPIVEQSYRANFYNVKGRGIGP